MNAKEQVNVKSGKKIERLSWTSPPLRLSTFGECRSAAHGGIFRLFTIIVVQEVCQRYGWELERRK